MSPVGKACGGGGGGGRCCSQADTGCCSGLRTTCQFNTKIFYLDDGKTPNLWSSDPLEQHGFSADKHSFHAKGCSVALSDDGASYAVKSSTNIRSVVDVVVSRAASVPGFVVGNDGTTTFGTDKSKPWGSMRHAFWPRCEVKGTIVTQAGPLDLKGRGFFVHALQGMKPHHAGQSPLSPISLHLQSDTPPQPPGGTSSTSSPRPTRP